MKRFHVLGFCLFLIYCQGLALPAQPGGFVSINCGAVSSYTEPTGIEWVPDANYTSGGSVANVSSTVTVSVPLQTLRYFPTTNGKHCFNIGPANVSSRYLVRATFLYGNYDGASAYPTFSISVDASPWATVTIKDATYPYFNEFIAVATSSDGFVVCLLAGLTGSPFISTLELRPLTGAMYSSMGNMKTNFFTSIARINFGALSSDSVRYPEDPVDRIWVSDQVWGLQGQAPGTSAISTNHSVVLTKISDVPPLKVMQTAAVGPQGFLSYRLNLPSYFPAYCYATLYFAEIQALGAKDVREFIFTVNFNNSLYTGVPLDLARDAGVYTAYEPGFDNASLPSILEFRLTKTSASTLNPLVNALEIYQILPIVPGTNSGDVAALSTFTQQLPAVETPGDPCLPVSWDFLACSSDSPPRVTEINLSGKNLSGSIPGAIGQMTSLINLWLDNNQLTGSIPDLSQLTELQSLHLQNNQLSGAFPSSLGNLGHLTEVFMANNNLTGTVPSNLLDKPGLLLNVSGNPYLCANSACAASSKSSINIAAIVGGTVGGAVFLSLLTAFIVAMILRRRYNNLRKIQKDPLEGSRFPFQATNVDVGYTNEEENPSRLPDGARLFHLPELVEATDNFSKILGSGGFGPVYYGKIAEDEQEVAVKVLSADSHQGAREFFNEVNLLSRVHHRNLVSLVGYCADIRERMLVYEYMHKGSLRDHLHGPLADVEPIDWLARLSIVLDAAKGLEYLHTGCNPSIIHRDVKSSNILITANWAGKIADFGLSKLTTEGVSAVSTNVRGTLGYLDPELYVSQRLTTKSDVFSFGVVLFEIITGRESIFTGPRGDSDTNLVSWARMHLQKGDVQSMVDPALGFNVQMETLWKLAELALRSVEPQSMHRPTMSEVVLELTEIISMETHDSTVATDSDSDSFVGFASARSRTHSPSTSYAFDSSSIAPLHSGSLDDSYTQPGLR